MGRTARKTVSLPYFLQVTVFQHSVCGTNGLRRVASLIALEKLQMKALSNCSQLCNYVAHSLADDVPKWKMKFLYTDRDVNFNQICLALGVRVLYQSMHD